MSRKLRVGVLSILVALCALMLFGPRGSVPAESHPHEAAPDAAARGHESEPPCCASPGSCPSSGCDEGEHAGAAPASLKAEHDELHAELARAAEAAGHTGQAAREVARVLHPHFVKEGQYAAGALALLPSLAAGKPAPDAKQIVAATDRLERELPQMLNEHREIKAALKNLASASRAEDKPEVARFAEKLRAHAQTEEEIMYPAAILVGKYLKLTAR